MKKPMRGARAILAAVTLVALAAVGVAPRIAQDPAYHDFADRRTILGIPNGLDVLSNLSFLLVGCLGLWTLLRGRSAAAFVERRERRPYVVLFATVAVTAFGSAYYHLAPDNPRLVWDRLPMALGFMSILCATVTERLSPALGKRLFWPALAAGVSSVVYWGLTEHAGAGDLRPYGFVQFYPAIAIPLMMALFPPRYTRGADMAVALLLYGVAKLAETADAAILSLGGIAGGHTLKHLAAAAATYWVLVMLRRRGPASPVAVARSGDPARRDHPARLDPG